MNKGWIGIDLDGTLAYYDGWQGINHIGDPIWTMVKVVKLLLANNVAVRIFTARCQEGEVAIKPIQEWCKEYIGQVLPITATKDFDMVAMIDDRAYNPFCYQCFQQSEGLIIKLMEDAKFHNDPMNPDNPDNVLPKPQLEMF